MNLSSATKLGAKVLGLGLWASAVYLGTNAILASKFDQKSQIETIWEKAKAEYDTYQEIKKEKIKADSYEEAKQKLDSIKMVKLYEKYGIECPSENASIAEKFNKQLELQMKMNEESQRDIQRLLETINTLDKN